MQHYEIESGWVVSGVLHRDFEVCHNSDKLRFLAIFDLPLAMRRDFGTYIKKFLT